MENLTQKEKNYRFVLKKKRKEKIKKVMLVVKFYREGELFDRYMYRYVSSKKKRKASGGILGRVLCQRKIPFRLIFFHAFIYLFFPPLFYP